MALDTVYSTTPAPKNALTEMNVEAQIAQACAIADRTANMLRNVLGSALPPQDQAGSPEPSGIIGRLIVLEKLQSANAMLAETLSEKIGRL